MSKFILTQNPEAYSALLDIGFAGCGVFAGTDGPIFLVFNSPKLGIPEAFKKECIPTDDMFLGLTVIER